MINNCQASVGSSVLRGKLARMRVSLCARAGILSALAPLLTEETVFLLSECRQASERQELSHDTRCPPVYCPEPEVADVDFECPFLCGLGTGVFVTLALAVTLRWLCFFRGKPSPSSPLQPPP